MVPRLWPYRGRHFCFMRMKKVKNEEEPKMEKNEEYNVDDDYYYNEFDNRVEDVNDYYK